MSRTSTQQYVIKGEIVTDLLGNVISFTALHLGVMHDATIWSLGRHKRPLRVGEYGLGDSIYASITELVTDFAPIANQGPGVPPLPLTAAEVQWNSGKNGVRSRIEHAVAEQQRPFGMYQTNFRGDPCILEACQIITAHANRAARRPVGSSVPSTTATGGSRTCNNKCKRKRINTSGMALRARARFCQRATRKYLWPIVAPVCPLCAHSAHCAHYVPIVPIIAHYAHYLPIMPIICPLCPLWPIGHVMAKNRVAHC
jgi:hypothetical protein